MLTLQPNDDDLLDLRGIGSPPGIGLGGPVSDAFGAAYRLMRLHERAGNLAALRSVGLRVARGEVPFRDLVEAQEPRRP